MAFEPRRTVRVIAAHANVNKEHETVNIVTSRSIADQLSIREMIQDTRGVSDRTIKTVLPAASTQKHLRTIYIPGYTAPV